MKKYSHYTKSIFPLAMLLLCTGCSSTKPTAQTPDSDTANTSSSSSSTASTNSTSKNTDTSDIDKLFESDNSSNSSSIAGTVLTSDDNMELSFVSADDSNIVFEVDNKTSENITFYCDSLAINKRSLNSQDYWESSNRIAPQSIGEFVFTFQDGADTSKYDLSNAATISGQFYYYVGELNDDNMHTITFSNAG